MLVFDEDKQYEKLEQFGFEKYPNRRDLLILARKWLSEGTNIQNIYSLMVEFCLRFNPQFNSVLNENLLMSVINDIKQELKNGKKFYYKNNIKIYKNEVDSILSLNDKNLQRVAFIIVSLAKWRNANYIYLNASSSISLKIIFDLAKVKLTGKQQKEILHTLNVSGFIDVQLKPLLKCMIPCVSDTGDIAIDYMINNDLIDVWVNYISPKCQRCGVPIVKITNNQKYCAECAKIVKQEKVNALKRAKRKAKE